MSALKEITSALKENNLSEFAEKIETIISQKQDQSIPLTSLKPLTDLFKREWSYEVMLFTTEKLSDEFEKELHTLLKKYLSKPSVFDGYIETLDPKAKRKKIT